MVLDIHHVAYEKMEGVLFTHKTQQQWGLHADGGVWKGEAVLRVERSRKVLLPLPKIEHRRLVNFIDLTDWLMYWLLDRHTYSPIPHERIVRAQLSIDTSL